MASSSRDSGRHICQVYGSVVLRPDHAGQLGRRPGINGQERQRLTEHGACGPTADGVVPQSGYRASDWHEQDDRSAQVDGMAQEHALEGVHVNTSPHQAGAIRKYKRTTVLQKSPNWEEWVTMNCTRSVV
jgi:hypothetical protein